MMDTPCSGRVGGSTWVIKKSEPGFAERERRPALFVHDWVVRRALGARRRCSAQEGEHVAYGECIWMGRSTDRVDEDVDVEVENQDVGGFVG